MIKQKYDKLRKKYPELPSFKELNEVFELSSIENSFFLLRDIRRKIIDKLEFLLKVLDGVLHPDVSSFQSMREFNYFSSDEKITFFNVYKRLMFLYRNLMEFEVLQDEREEAVVISRVFSEWNGMKNNLFSFLSRLKFCWEKDIKTDEILRYFG